MGLDMYLTAEAYLPSYGDSEEKQKADQVRKFVGDLYPVVGTLKGLTTEVAYWRKANAIHKWFVDNVQGGVDECQRSYVSREQLTALRDLCKSVLEKPDRAESAMPTQSGFFFGSTGYDQYYYEDLELTVKQLTTALDSPDELDFYYQASW